MNFRKATNEQLTVLIQHERNIPKHLMKKIVEEHCNRNLFDGFIIRVLKSVNMEFNDDLIQQGYLYIIESLSNYKTAKNNAFATFLFTHLKNKFVNYIRDVSAKKRKSNWNNLYLEQKIKDDTETTFLDQLLDSRRSVEDTVINKLFIEESLNKVTPRQKETLILFSQGYKMAEIARKTNVSHVTVRQSLDRAFKNIFPERPNVSLNELKLTRGRG